LEPLLLSLLAETVTVAVTVTVEAGAQPAVVVHASQVLASVLGDAVLPPLLMMTVIMLVGTAVTVAVV